MTRLQRTLVARTPVGEYRNLHPEFRKQDVGMMERAGMILADDPMAPFLMRMHTRTPEGDEALEATA